MTSETKKKMRKNVVVILVLLLMLGVTTFALMLSFVEVEDNRFVMGRVDIELNGGKPVFDGSDHNIEPNYTIIKEFTIENKGTADAYYRLYMDNVVGSLQEVLNFKIYEEDKLLYDGSVKKLTKETPCVGDNILKAGETRVLRAEVKISENSSNKYQAGSMTFDITADAVQVKNNPDREFD